MRLDADHYFQAALQRIEQARFLYQRGDGYALSMYVAGVAVECMLRAFKLRKDSVIDERHDLLQLLDNSGIMNTLSECTLRREQTDRAELDATGLKDAVKSAALLWANDFRYAANERLRSHLTRLRLGFRIKGDFLKGICLKLLVNAETVVEIGVKLWKSSQGK